MKPVRALRFRLHLLFKQHFLYKKKKVKLHLSREKKEGDFLLAIRKFQVNEFPQNALEAHKGTEVKEHRSPET
jgi:hypothetical protein